VTKEAAPWVARAVLLIASNLNHQLTPSQRIGRVWKQVGFYSDFMFGIE
jgi:hypothetical protein